LNTDLGGIAAVSNDEEINKITEKLTSAIQEAIAVSFAKHQHGTEKRPDVPDCV
jgi:hypothetical protein